MVEQHIARLKELQLLQRIGLTNKGYWEVLKCPMLVAGKPEYIQEFKWVSCSVTRHWAETDHGQIQDLTSEYIDAKQFIGNNQMNKDILAPWDDCAGSQIRSVTAYNGNHWVNPV